MLGKKKMKRAYLIRCINNDEGSALLFSIFVVLTLSLLCISYWKLIELYARSVYLKEKGLQTYQIAKSGIEDSLYEIKIGTPWDVDHLAGHGWTASGNQFIKSTVLKSLNPLLFDYPATFSVTVSGNIADSTVNITSIAEVGSVTANEKVFKRTITSDIIKTVAGEIYIIKMQEI